LSVDEFVTSKTQQHKVYCVYGIQIKRFSIMNLLFLWYYEMKHKTYSCRVTIYMYIRTIKQFYWWMTINLQIICNLISISFSELTCEYKSMVHRDNNYHFNNYCSRVGCWSIDIGKVFLLDYNSLMVVGSASFNRRLYQLNQIDWLWHIFRHCDVHLLMNFFQIQLMMIRPQLQCFHSILMMCGLW
jgi:hypothetical protein